LARKEYTHVKGFNVTSLIGVSGVYLFIESCCDTSYIGMCDKDFKNRMSSHTNKTNGKLNLDIQYIHVIIADTSLYPLHVLEHLFIWYFRPPKNDALWIFGRCKNENQVKMVAKDKAINIRGSIEKFLLSFHSIMIEREWDNNFELIKYGEIEHVSSKKRQCDGTRSCLCYECVVNRRKEERLYRDLKKGVGI
jgi:hypothetical protein